MFEKDAEEYANRKGHEHYNYLFEENAGSPADFARCCFKDGAEFGYNKANEWHFVSKEGHPNKDDIYLTIRKDGLHLGDYCQGGDGEIDCQSWCDYPSEEEIQDDSVIAWKEIVLPELPNESEIKREIFPEIILPEGSAEFVDKAIADAEKLFEGN